MKLSPQQETIVDVLRDKGWHCSSEFGYIKDDRRRIFELNEGYMLSKGYQIEGKRCDGRCGKNHSSGLFMRRAVKISDVPLEEQFQNYWLSIPA
jgi:hypothetical protein